MCGRYTLRTPLNVLAEQFLFELGDFQAVPRYNIPPTTEVLAVRHPRELSKFRWGLIPSWAKDAKIAYSTINARADTVATKPAFRAAYKKRRCLVLADGYFEWRKEGKAKLPLLYEVDGGKPFALAGLWDWWGGPEGENKPVESCTIITTDANELAKQVHDRMPVILDAEDYDAWLACEEVPLAPFPSDRMTARPVSTYVNNVKNQGPACLDPPTAPSQREGVDQ
jgi:putative SOS response-associated peptidase YedK